METWSGLGKYKKLLCNAKKPIKARRYKQANTPNTFSIFISTPVA
jgi:hypothetical protein